MNEDARLEAVDTEDSAGRRFGTRELGWLLIGSGAVTAVVNLIRGHRDLVDWAVPLGLVGIGSGVLLKRRQSHIDVARENIMAELDLLDPIARAQVLKAVAQEQMGRLSGGSA